MELPADAHVHSEFSWDGGSDPAAPGRMKRTCARAERIGLSTVIFTEHLDLEEQWRAEKSDLGEHAWRHLGTDGYVHLPRFDLEGYLEAVDRCRAAHPGLRILTGVEYGQPHLWDSKAAPLLSRGDLDRVNGSLHTLPFNAPTASAGDRAEPITLYRHQPAEDVMWSYLAEVPRMVEGSSTFEVFTHIDYAVRTWPTDRSGPFDPRRFEEGFRTAMRSIAGSDRALEMNTRRLWPWIPKWWREEGGKAVSFGSDAHVPQEVAAHFPEATAMLEAFGFQRGRRPEDFWTL